MIRTIPAHHAAGDLISSTPLQTRPGLQGIAGPHQSQDDVDLHQQQQLQAKLEQLNQHSTQRGEIDTDVQRNLERHWRHDRSVHQDWLASSPHSERRRQELHQLPGGEKLAGQYGLSISMAKKMEREINPQLRITNQVDAHYQRDAPSQAFRQRCLDIFAKQGGNPRSPVVFINSINAAERVLTHLPKEHLDGETPRQYLNRNLKPLQAGLFALKLDSREAQTTANYFTYAFGGTPSLYGAMETALPPMKHTQPPRPLSNLALVDTLRGEPGTNVIDRLKGLPRDHNLAALSDTAGAMIDTLLDTIEDHQDNPRVRSNPLLHQGLTSLRNIADVMPSLTHDSRKFISAYHALVEEIGICLGAFQPYNHEGFIEAASDMLPLDQLSPNIPVPRPYLTSSGMGAITQAVELVSTLTGKPDIRNAFSGKYGESPAYFEVDYLRRVMKFGENSREAIYATLNHSLPGIKEDDSQRSWDVDGVIDATRRSLGKTPNNKPLLLVLDATLERPNDLSKLAGHFSREIEDGKLRLLICKSYQKYSNLGTAKVMAGSISLISKADGPAREALMQLRANEKDLAWYHNPETQLLTHLLRHRDQEFAQLNQATANARFVRENFFNGKNGNTRFDGVDSHLPFSLHKDNPAEMKHRFSFNLGGQAQRVSFNRSGHLNKEAVRYRDSFAFANTTRAGIPMEDDKLGMRLCYGQESQAELTESFYMAGKLMHAKGSKWSVTDAHKEVNLLINQSLGNKAALSTAPLLQKLNDVAKKEYSTTSPIMDAVSNVETLRHLREADPKAGRTFNKIASVLIHASGLIREYVSTADCCGGADRSLLDELLNAMLDSGMPGVSSSGRGSILALYNHLAVADMTQGSPDQQLDAMKRLARAAQRYPAQAGNADMLTTIPDRLFKRADSADQQAVIDAMFSPLDAKSKVGMIDHLIKKHHFATAESCIQRFEQQLDKLMLAPSGTLANTAEPGVGPHSLPMADRKAIRDRLIQQQLEARRPPEGVPTPPPPES
ncbi:hypothetical protein ACKC9G_09410 [Pokkaliibacter sp. CJK22405]|uniref:hypothetical protein n=1 Tax=Pokkaliibacter sp. CJK22405 TaxID=3384615 RepID=UPI003985026D